MAHARKKDDRKLRRLLTAGALVAAGAAGLCVGPVGPAGAATPASGTPTNPMAGALGAMAGSERFTMDLSVAASVPGSASTTLRLSANGVVDNPAGTPHGVGQTPGLGAADLHLHVATVGTVDLRMLGGVLFVRLPETLAAKIPGTATKPWLALNLAALRAKLGSSARSTTAVATMPDNVLAALGQVATVTKVGTATIRHAPTTEYVADIQISKLAAIDPALSTAQAEQLQAALPSGTMPIAVWLDAEGRVRQVHLRLVVPVPPTAATSTAPSGTSTGTATGGTGTATGTAPVTATGTVTVSFTMDLFAYGPAATFSAPPPSQVQDVTKQLETALAGGAGAGLGLAGRLTGASG